MASMCVQESLLVGGACGQQKFGFGVLCQWMGKKGKPVGCEKLLRKEKTVHEAGVCDWYHTLVSTGLSEKEKLGI